jgi:antitoxin (DNA-binding transcriptional repressor) of toxin-antitoxin stability system
MAIKCGHCREAHATVAQVRACSETPNVPRAIRERSWTADDREQAERPINRQERDSLSDLIREVDELLCTKVVPASEHRWSRAVRAMISGDSATITRHGLRTAIARLEAYPNVRAGSTPATEEGLYRLDGRLYQVLRGRESQRLYAKLVTFAPEGSKRRPTLTYQKGIIFQLTTSHLLPVEEAQEITRKTGWCIFGHLLTDPKSIARGMGPTCYARYPHLAKDAVA